jgi:hypothetical protein
MPENEKNGIFQLEPAAVSDDLAEITGGYATIRPMITPAIGNPLYFGRCICMLRLFWA